MLKTKGDIDFKNFQSFINTRLFFIIAFAFLLLNFADKSPFFFPQFLIGFDYATSKEILNNIISAASSILGITVAVLIISVEFLRNKFDNYAFQALLKNKPLGRVITLFLLSIILPLFTYIFLTPEKLTVFDFNRIYFLVILFTITLLVLFHSLPSLIKSTNSTELIHDLVNKWTYAKIAKL